MLMWPAVAGLSRMANPLGHWEELRPCYVWISGSTAVWTGSIICAA